MLNIITYMAKHHPALLYIAVLLLTIGLGLVLPFLAVTGFPQ